MTTENSKLNRADLQALFQYAMTLCQQRENAQDILQIAVESYLVEIKSGNNINNRQGYIRRIIRNRFIDFYRYDQRWALEQFEEQARYDISPIDLEQLTINQQALQRLWQLLAPVDRDILYHWAVLGYSTDEACEILQMPRGTFLSRLHRIRKFCKSQVELAESGIGGGEIS
ncbi:MAG: sigma-70 family RNA polymerase sigma factor [Pseudomonadales bacterium]|nr:sigma-70 family RNA polymerase sigma factor [Pseudomonadales bacterium]